MSGLKSTKVSNILGDDGHFISVPGAYCITENGDRIEYICPCGCGDVRAIPIKAGEYVKGLPFWGWDGNRDSPTLIPSIKHMDGCKWHGHLSAGVWESC
jgi:hypothetical protein